MLVGVALLALAAAYYGWLRDSSLVAVRDVKVEGVSGADRERIVTALTGAAREMTTLHVRTDRLASAVGAFPSVASVSADASLPHGLTIQVSERRPALIARDGDEQVPVAADGSLLRGLELEDERLPALHVDSLPASGRLSGDPLAEARVIGAAPAPLRPLVEDAAISRDHGVVVTARGGIELRFGGAGRAGSKWRAVAAILTDPNLTSLSYVDVAVPDRPAVGGG